MVSTRLRTGAIAPTKYDYDSLLSRQEAQAADDLRPSEEKESTAGTGTKSAKRSAAPGEIGKPPKRNRKAKDILPELPFDPKDIEQHPGSALYVADGEEEFVFQLPVIIGEQENHGMSIIERADKLVDQLTQLHATHVQHMPRAAPILKVKLMQAVEARKNLVDTRENHEIINLELQAQAIAARITALKTALAESKFGPEQDNIRCAIAEYETGPTPWRQDYTIIWGGRVVDHCNTYGDFTKDRGVRLDRYAKQYGAGWLWYETGLDNNPWTAPRMSKAAELTRTVDATGLGQYKIPQCFSKRAGWVTRLAGMPAAIPEPEDVTPVWATNELGQVYCQTEGPRIVFSTLLDSGATFPSLHPEDFELLGIDNNFYAAQSLHAIATANGTINMRAYEMVVTVTDWNMDELVDPANAVWPYHPKSLGGFCPVLVCAGVQTAPGPNGFIASMRLSGVMPFLACYVSSVPTRNKMFLGEDRNDVLGAHKFPGQRRWDIGMPSTEPVGAAGWDVFGEPKILFSHLDGQVVDKDFPDVDHASVIVCNVGLENEVSIVSNPKAACDAARAAPPAAGGGMRRKAVDCSRSGLGMERKMGKSVGNEIGNWHGGVM